MQAQEMKDFIVTALENLKARDITVVDVSDRTSVTDYMVIASGTSSRHVRSIAEQVVIDAKAQGIRPPSVEGGVNSDWVLVDMGDVVVHVMLPATREFYDIERFWRDAPTPDRFREDQDQPGP